MRPVLFHLGPLTVHSYGFFLALAFLVGMGISFRYLRSRFVDAYIVFELVLAAAVGGIVGARAFYVLGHLGEFRGRWGDAFKFWNVQGLVFYGGLLLGFAAGVAVIKWRKAPFGVIADSAGLALPLSLAVARIGCFLNGCCFGKPSGLPWAVTFPVSTQVEMGMPKNPLHPTQVYELLMALGIFVVLSSLLGRFRRRGEVMLGFLLLYGAARFVNEFFRYHDNPRGGLFFQVLSAIIFVGSGLALLFRHRLLPENR
jgi:phosphatidylglycerol:prolipoprotein diacylglycerol transferase